MPPLDEEQQAKDYWARSHFDYYHTDGPQRALIVRAIRALRRAQSIRSVFEFGCNVGRTLHLLQRELDGVRVRGLDINEAAVADGRSRYGLDLDVGDETALARIPSGAFDCSFTVSVLDHVTSAEHVQRIVREMRRVTRGPLLLLEPFNGRNERAAEVRTRFNYYWDYPRIARDLGLRVLTDLRYPLGDLPMQRAYRLYVLGSSPEVRGLPRRVVMAERIGVIWADLARRARAARSRA